MAQPSRNNLAQRIKLANVEPTILVGSFVDGPSRGLIAKFLIGHRFSLATIQARNPGK